MLKKPVRNIHLLSRVVLYRLRARLHPCMPPVFRETPNKCCFHVHKWYFILFSVERSTVYKVLIYFFYISIKAACYLKKAVFALNSLGFCGHNWMDICLKKSPGRFLNFSYSPPFKNIFIVLAVKNAEQGWLNNVYGWYLVIFFPCFYWPAV